MCCRNQRNTEQRLSEVNIVSVCRLVRCETDSSGKTCCVFSGMLNSMHSVVLCIYQCVHVQLPPSSVVVILAASDPTYTTVHHQRLCISCGSSGTVCRLTSAQLQHRLFFGTASKLTFSPDHFLTTCFRFLVLYTVYSSGLAVVYLGHS